MVEQGSQGNTDSSLAGAGGVAGPLVSETTAISDPEQAGPSRALESQGQPNSELVQQVFGLFKTCLTSQLDENGKQLQTQSKIEKKPASSNPEEIESSSSLTRRLTRFSLILPGRPALSVLFFRVIERSVLMALLFYYKDMLEKVMMQRTQQFSAFVCCRKNPVKCNACAVARKIESDCRRDLMSIHSVQKVKTI